MMQLAPRAAAPPQTLAHSLTELPFGSQTQVRVGDGHLAAFLAYVAYDKRICVATYALRVLNNTGLPVRAKLFVEAKGLQVSAYPLAVEIAPFSMRDEVMPVRMDVTGWFDRAIVHVVSDQSAFTVEAPPPPRERPKWTRWAAAGAAALAAAAATQFAQPRVLAVEAPQKALAGSTIRVPYQVSGIGSVEYDFDTRDGLQLSAGLSSQSDVLKLQIPQDGVGAPYTLHLRMRNAFTKAESAATIAAVIPPKPRKPATTAPAPLINNLAVSPSPAVAGSTLLVRYSTNAQSGDVWLLDSTGATWAHQPLSPSGSTQLPVPQAAAGREMRVVLHAQRAAAHAQSSVDVAVMPSQNVVAQTSATAQPAPEAKPAPAAGAELKLSSQVVSAGDTVTVSVSGVSGDVRVTLMNANGGTMAEGDADEDQGVTLNAPNVTTPTTFYVVATLTSGVSQQSIVKRLYVTPR